MRTRILVEAVAIGLLYGLSAAAGESREPKLDPVGVEAALDEPADPDDAVDIRADDDPQDVGQEALDPAAATPPAEPQGPGDDPALR